jgi:predicted ester cyclase
VSTEENKRVVRRFYEEVMNQGNADLLDEIMAEDFVDHGEALFGSPQGRETLKEGVRGARGVLPDLHVTLHEVNAEGQLVGVRGTMRCTHQGSFLNVAPTGHELSWLGLAIFRVVDGRITERWFNSDSISILRQMELAPVSPSNCGARAGTSGN